MTAAIRGNLVGLSRRGVVLTAIALATIGATTGAMLQQAFGNNINCSHVQQACIGSWGNDQIYGWQNGNEIVAQTGLDDAWGYESQDYMWGGGDADALFGGPGADWPVNGDAGNDSYFKVGGGAGFGVYGNSEPDHLEGNTGHDLVQGDYGSDNMAGGDNEDRMFAEDGGGADTVQGGGQFDECWVDNGDSWAGCESVF